jgi:hypothetical protein
MSSKTLIKLSAETKQIIDKIAELILECDSILFTSGAGMGVSSGLGTFRGIGADVWPPLLEEPKMDYMDICDPSWFRKEEGNSIAHNTANFGYAFWVYGYNSFTKAIPHQGYFIAKQWSQLKSMVIGENQVGMNYLLLNVMVLSIICNVLINVVNKYGQQMIY